MVTALWGATVDLSIAWPATVSGWLLLFCYAVVAGVLLYQERQTLARLSWKQWLLLFLLSSGAVLLALIEPPIPVPSFLSMYVPASMGDGQTITVALLSAVPYLLAGVIFGPAPALIVGFFSGLGRVVGLSNQPYDPFSFAFAAYIAARMMEWRYYGRIYRLLRSPLISGMVGQASAAVFGALAALSTTSGLMASLDAALATFKDQIWPMLAEGLISGVLVTVLATIMAQWLPQRRLRPSPAQRSIGSFLKTNVAVFGTVVWIFAAVFVFFLSTILASRVIVTELAASSNTAAARVDELRSALEDILSSSGDDEDFARGDKASAARGLGRAYRNAKHFQEVMLVDQDFEVVYTFPAEETEAILTESEQEAVARAVEDGLMTQTVADLPGKGRALSVVVPVAEREGQPPKALVGRLPASMLSDIMAPLLVNNSTSMIIDRTEEIVIAAGAQAANPMWKNPENGEVDTVYVPEYLGGDAYLMDNARQSRDIHYLTPPNASAWRVVATMPYENVLNEAFKNALPVMLVLFTVTTLLYTRVASYGKNLTVPLTELAQASRTIAAGGDLSAQVDVHDRQDEVGELGRAFTGMQKALKVRLDELSLLLDVSQDISTSLDIYQSMPIILQGAVRGTSGAVGARAAIVNPRGRIPLVFSEGPAGDEMAFFDRTLMLSLRSKKDMSFKSPQSLSQMFGLREENLPVKSLFAVPLQLNNNFLGAFFIGYRQKRELSRSEKDLLHTLAGQASVLVENAYLFARAENGRRRLETVLDSTSDPVIVTDQTNRIFMLNKAMAEAFNLSFNQVRNRSVGDVLNSPELVKALTASDNKKRNLEVKGKNGSTYGANISPITSRTRLTGHVAVLHDVTRFKEADSLKSEFVGAVAHDLKSPLTIIHHSAQELLVDDLTVAQEGLTRNILGAVNRIVNFVDTMLDIERLEAGKELIYQDFDVAVMLDELKVDQYYHVQKGGLKLRTEAAKKLPRITADRGQVYQAVENLISNAIKYAPNSGELLLTVVLQGDKVVISLRDKGPGISDRDQMRLFEKGYRVDQFGAKKVEGNGMGLALVRTIAERHGGRAWVESVKGKGSVFSISVPVKPK